MDPAAEFLMIEIIISEIFNISEVLETNCQHFHPYIFFFQSPEWSEPWFIGLVAFHVIITLLTILTRKKLGVQAALYFIISILTLFSEQLNQIAAENWRYYSKQQYFDANGIFISTMFCAPLLFNCILILANWNLIAIELMASLIRLRHQQQNNNNNMPNAL